MGRRNLINEIEEVKQRNNGDININLLAKILEIRESLNEVSKLEKNKKLELIKYIPISIVACIQSYFRELIIELVDSGEPYSKNIAKFNQVKNIKFDFEILNAIKKEKFSSGELIAHLLPCNNLNDFNSGLSILTQTNFLDELKNTKLSTETEDQLFVDNFPEIIKSINRVFELRNIYCHEYSFGVNISDKEINEIFKHFTLFLAQVLAYFLIPTIKTEKEIIEDVEKKYTESSRELENLVELIIEKSINNKLSNTFNEKLFRESIKKWKDYISAKIDFEYGILKSTRLNSLRMSLTISETENKINELRGNYKNILLNNLDLESDSLRSKLLKLLITRALTE